METNKLIDELQTKVKQLRREQEIQAALERVRAKAMAMHQSDELSHVVAQLYEEISAFGMSAFGFELILFKPQEDALEYWTNPASLQFPKCYKVSRCLHSFIERQWQEWENKQSRLVLVLEGQEKVEFDNALFQETGFKEWPEEVQEVIKKQESVTFSHAYTKYGFLEAIDQKPLDEVGFTVLEQFAKVFEQTYSRFLDLKKAECQTKEAQIEVALERVRASSMSMQKSDDMMEVVNVLFRQMKSTGIAAESSWVVLTNLKNETLEYWIKHKDQKAEAVLLNARDSPVFSQILESHRTNLATLVDAVPKSDFINLTNEFFHFKVPDQLEKEVNLSLIYQSISC